MDIQIDWYLLAIIVAPILAAIISVILDRYLRQPKLVYYLVHAATTSLRFTGNGQNTAVNTHSVVVKNVGRAPAHNVRLSHYLLPPTFSINPPARYSTEDVPDSGPDIVIPILVRNEQVTLTYLYAPPTTWRHVNSDLKCDEGMGQALSVLTVRRYPRWVNAAILYLMIVGLITSLYLLMDTIRTVI